MARGRSNGYSITQLERLLEKAKSSVDRLLSERASLLKQLENLDRKIEAAGGSVDGSTGRGSAGRTAGGRIRNEMSLSEALESVMKGQGSMAVSDILDAVLATGYKSTSANFRGIINQTLIKDKKFVATDRGMYTIK